MKPAAVLFLLVLSIPAHAGEGSGGVPWERGASAPLTAPALTITLPPELPAAETFTLASQTPEFQISNFKSQIPKTKTPVPATAHIHRATADTLTIFREAGIRTLPNPPKRYSPLWFMRGRVRTHADLVRYYQFLSAADENRRLSR